MAHHKLSPNSPINADYHSFVGAQTQEETANNSSGGQLPHFPLTNVSKNRRHSDPTHDGKSSENLAALLRLQQQQQMQLNQRYRYGRDVATGNLEYLHHRLTIDSEHPMKSSQSTAIFMLCAVSLGVGVFVLPGILNLTGIGTGVLMLVGYAVLAIFTQLLTLECGHDADVESYEELASKTWGKFGEFVLAVFMAISLLTGNCGHIQTVGQLLHDIIAWFYTGDNYDKYHFEWKKTAILYSVMLSLTIPWLFQKSLKGLSGVGTLSVLTVCLTAVSMIVVCIINLAKGEGAGPDTDNAPVYGFSMMTKSEFWITDFWRACPAIAFVYTPILELFPVYNELNARDVYKTKRSVYIASLICLTVYVVVAVIVVITYGTDTIANSLYNIPANNYWITFCCFLLVIVITLLYPVINYPMLNAIETIFELFGCCKQTNAMMISDEDDGIGGHVEKESFDYVHDDEMDDITLVECGLTPSIWWKYIIYRRREILSILSVFLVIAVDIGVTDLDDLFGLCGSLGLSFVCYIFPCLIWLRMQHQNGTLSCCSFKLWFTIFVLLFSTAVMVYSTAVIIINIIHK